MRLGRRLVVPAVALAAAVGPALSGCGLIDLFDGGSNVHDALEYVPAGAFFVQFAGHGAMVERLELDDIDPRDITDGDLEQYIDTIQGDETSVATTVLDHHLQSMRGAPLNALDVEWEASAAWDRREVAIDGGTMSETDEATLWKVGDDLDFDALAADLEDKGYARDRSGDAWIYSVDRSTLDRTDGTIGGVYPQTMPNLLLDEDEQIVATSFSVGSLGDVADVIDDDADSLADEAGFEELLDAAEGETELAWLNADAESVCSDDGPTAPEELRSQYEDLGRPAARALFVSADEDPPVRLVLQFDSEADAEDDADAREELIEEGVEPLTSRPFEELGDFDLDQDGELVVVDEEFDGGAAQSLNAVGNGGGAGFCLPEDD